ncbi:MAG: CHAP domain-containing protein [Alphaproteobacteria bacterium]|nr:CHAP domain-containing protein [Alphaproteobacteria bacterium]NCQ87726.1 CHAP domain-containing protein [Alphaproteobacteria bacterium]NCT05765.1 CHAP domain-containing protein [Alphaproteobacteria bacterium]
MKTYIFSALLAPIILLSACSTVEQAGSQKSFYKISEQMQCVPYAREVSGISIYGDAHTWWGQAAGKYSRGALPKVGSVMVLSKTSRLKHGHLAVVKRVVNSRKIEVEHVNWGDDMKTRKMIYKAMPVIDASDNNDWSSARFWHYPTSTFGSAYPVSGFIYKPMNNET